MVKHVLTPIAALAVFMATGVTHLEAKRVKESAELFISFELLPLDETSTASGSAEIELNRHKGDEETSFDFSVEGLAEGSYVVQAEAGEDVVDITEFVVEPAATDPVTGEPVTDDPSEEEAEIELPAGINPLEIDAITVVKVETVAEQVVATVVLRGEADASATYWMFNANVKVTGPTVVAPVEESPTEEEPAAGPGKGKGKGKKVKGAKVKKVHGHVVVHALIVGDQEKKRKFLFNAHGAPANTELTLNIDGDPVQTVTSSHNGKVMIKSLDDAEVRVAGIRLITVTDAEGTVIMEAQF